MKPREVARYLEDLGWRDPAELPEGQGRSSSGVATPEGGRCSSATECATLAELAAFLDGCRRCGLAERRNAIVFGEGAENAALMFVGEGPGAEEDRTGRPFVGQAGKLLDAMIVALGMRRDDVFIANVVKCRPPGNRDPRQGEVAACAPFLERQIELIRPGVLVALGKPAANRLTGADKSMKAMRGRWMSYRGIPLLATYHPAYLLRSPGAKRAVWEDLKMVLRRLSEPQEG